MNLRGSRKTRPSIMKEEVFQKPEQTSPSEKDKTESLKTSESSATRQEQKEPKQEVGQKLQQREEQQGETQGQVKRKTAAAWKRPPVANVDFQEPKQPVVQMGGLQRTNPRLYALGQAPILKSDGGKVTLLVGNKVEKMALLRDDAVTLAANVRAGQWLNRMQLKGFKAADISEDKISWNEANVIVERIKTTNPIDYANLRVNLDKLKPNDGNDDELVVPRSTSEKAAGIGVSELLVRYAARAGTPKALPFKQENVLRTATTNLGDKPGVLDPQTFKKSYAADVQQILKFTEMPPTRFQPEYANNPALLDQAKAKYTKDKEDNDNLIERLSNPPAATNNVEYAKWIKDMDRQLDSYKPSKLNEWRSKLALERVLVGLKAPLALGRQTAEKNANDSAADFVNWLQTPAGSEVIIRMACADLLIGMPDRIIGFDSDLDGKLNGGNFTYADKALIGIDNAKADYNGQPMPKSVAEDLTIGSSTISTDSYKGWISTLKGLSTTKTLTSTLTSKIRTAFDGESLEPNTLQSFKANLTEQKVATILKEVLSAASEAAKSGAVGSDVMQARVGILQEAL